MSYGHIEGSIELAWWRLSFGAIYLSWVQEVPLLSVASLDVNVALRGRAAAALELVVGHWGWLHCNFLR